MQHRVIAVEASTDGSGPGLLVRTRVAAPGRREGLLTTYAWTADDEALGLTLSVTPDGIFTVPLPHLGIGLTVPGHLAQVDWFGGGPGEAYVDSRQAVHIGRFGLAVDQMQTPYVRPQEYGNRVDVRWVTLTHGSGGGLRVDGRPTFQFAARRWSSSELEAARHRTDLVAGDSLHLSLDLGHTGLGSASCGPGVMPEYQLPVADYTFSLVLRAIS
jgi:beta-galactosidase